MTTIEEFFGMEGPLAKKFEGYKPRPQQIELASAIEKALLAEEPLMGEAPTGVGKSLAALVPAFRLIKKYDAPVVVVTSSILLQEQYMYKDIPMLEELMNFKVNPVLLKGKSNYLCLDKLVNQKATGTNSDQSNEIAEVLNWSAKTKTGDVSELDFVPSYPVWSEFAITDQHECAGKKCPLFNQCFYYANRSKVKTAKLIVCNYHYYFTALKSEGMLPLGIRAVIFDEGHEIPSIARDMEEKEYNVRTFEKLNKMLAKAQKKIATITGEVGIADEIELGPLLDSLQKVFMDMTRFYHNERPKGKDNWVIEDGVKFKANEIGKEHLECLHRTNEALKSHVERYAMSVEAMGWEDSEEEVEWQHALMRYQEGVEERLLLAERFFGLDKPNLPYEVLNWMEMSQGEYITLRSKPFNATPITGPVFSHNENTPGSMEVATPIVISATLSVNKTFNHLKHDLGITGFVNELIVSSPFNLTENLLWYLPKDIPAGNDPSHLPVVLREMEKIIRVLNGRTLCLFTSHRAMQSGMQHLSKMFPNSNVISQGQMTKKKIIEEMKTNPKTVIVATKSFFTGVDIQGPNLAAVLIDKLPFPMVGDPINEYLMNSERGFWKHTLPETVITMKQGFGRLNRTVDDKGVVSVFDGRLSTSGYKDRIFNSFDFKVTATRDFDRVKEYLEGIIHAYS